MDGRSETFFMDIVGVHETFFPKPSGTVRRVKAIRVLGRDNIFADPYNFLVLDKLSANLCKLFFTFRTRDNRELLVNVPAFMLAAGVVKGSAQRAVRPLLALADLDLDPQRCSAFLSDAADKCTFAVQFIYE